MPTAATARARASATTSSGASTSKSLDSLAALPPLHVLHQEVIDHVEAALAAFRDVAAALPRSTANGSGCWLKLTRGRTGELLRVLQASVALDQPAPKVTRVADDSGNSESGIRRFEKIVPFATVDCVKAGWFLKQEGIRTDTDEGRAAFKKYPDGEAFYRRAVKLYGEWRNLTRARRRRRYGRRVGRGGRRQVRQHHLRERRGTGLGRNCA